jgi:hypothetical protein
MNIEECFKQMLSKLNPTEKQVQGIRTTRDTIDSVLQSDNRVHLFSGKQISFFTGSYSRKTIIRPINDIDLYVRVHFSAHAEGKGPREILILIAKALRRRYPGTKVDVDAPCVVVKFFDYNFEIVPAIGYQDDPDCYMIPAPGSREWAECYPNVPSKWLTNSNHANNQMFIPLIKILKQWNRNNKVGLKSFHLELLTGMVFDEISEIVSYPQAVYEWMHHVCKWIHAHKDPFVNEPGKSLEFVDEYLYENKWKIKVIRQKLFKGLRQSESAYYDWINGKIGKSKLMWKQMFGSMFPMPLPVRNESTQVNPQPPLGRLVPPKTFPALPSGSRPNFLATGLLNEPKFSLNHLLNTPLSQQPIETTNALLALLGKPEKKYPWDK